MGEKQSERNIECVSWILTMAVGVNDLEFGEDLSFFLN